MVQPSTIVIDFPANQLLLKVEKDYNMIEREALKMVYVVYIFKIYLLATPFMFYVNHQSLMYLVNKPIIQGRVSLWLLLLLEFTFTIIV
jgi:hypothetical protein